MKKRKPSERILLKDTPKVAFKKTCAFVSLPAAKMSLDRLGRFNESLDAWEKRNGALTEALLRSYK